MESCEMQFDVMSQKLVTQELRINQRALEELKKEYEALKVREQSLIEGARWERGRTKAQEDRAMALQRELEKLQEEKESIQKEKDVLQKELTNFKRKSTDSSSRTQLESEIINYRTKIAGLESRLSRRQAEFERSEETLRNEIEKLQSMIDSTQSRLINDSTSEKENLDSSNVEQVNQLHYKMGSLTATNESLRSEITRHLADKADMEHEIKNLKEELDSAKNMIKILQDRLAETEGSNDFTSKYWSEEMNKVKNQKAEIRVELLKLKKEHQKLLQDIQDGTIGKINQDVTKYETEISDLKQQLKEYRSKLEESQRLLAEAESSGKGEVEQLKSELLKANEKVARMKDALTTLDNQAEELLNSVKTENAAKKTARKRILSLEKELSELQAGEANRKALEDEIAALKVENDRLIDKIAYLENEIKETHTDHREELAKLAKQLTATRANASSQDTRQKDELSKKVIELESTVRQNESVIRSLNRLVEQSKAEVSSAESALSDMREKQCTVVTENTELRKALNDAILKIKSHADKTQSLTTTVDEQKGQISRLTEMQSQLRDEISELRDELQQKEENIAYLQSIVQPRKLEKLKITHSQSTLVTGPAEDPELEQLMQKRTELAREVAEKARALEQKKEQIVPLMKNISGCSGSSSMDASRSSSPTASRSRVGTMRHDIPHRWSKTLALWMPPKCDSCYEAMPMFSYILRCKSCSLVVHPHCQSVVLNTCGLPTACANFYVDHHSISTDNMSGWVKIWRSNDTPGSKWCNAFAMMEGNKLSFYETDVALAQNDAPMLTVDLSQERWRIYNQTGSVKGIESANADCLIEIKLKNLSLFMLTRTPEAKRAWIQALQNATDRRILERNGSNRRIMSMSVILRMGQPLLKFQCTQVYDDWLLVGTPQGLFATSFSHPRMPFQVAGFSNVLQMKLIKEHNLLFAIDGVDRNVVAIHSQQLDSALNANSAPFIQPTAYSHLPAAHLIEASETHHCKERYLYVATTEGITVLHYIPKKDMFVPTAEIKLEVPAMCIISCKGGFVFGSDTFYFVEAGQWNPCSFRVDWPPDLPIGVVKITEDEILVVNHNCGVFTTPRGQRTREGIVEWDRIPLSVTYVEPYLLIVYTNMISVARVLPMNECKSEDSPLIEELEGYRAPMARVTGFGKTESDVLVTVMNDSCVELNCFSASKQTLKRKTTTSVSHLQPSKKRS